MAALARLKLDHGWPADRIGTQSIDWAFDLVAFTQADGSEFIPGEVKKTRRELGDLIALMRTFGADPTLVDPPAGKQRNAWKKAVALRARRAPLFWAVGPDRAGGAYRVCYATAGSFELAPVDTSALDYAVHGWINPLDLLRSSILDRPIIALDGNHSARLWRIAANLPESAAAAPTHAAVAHLFSRVAVLARGMTADLRSASLSPENAAALLDQLAMAAEPDRS